MRHQKRLNFFFVFVTTLLVMITSTSCVTITLHPKSNSNSNPQSQPTTSAMGTTGTVTLGTEVSVASQSISNTSGGTITISKPGDPLDGFVLGIPPNSYTNNRTFEVSYAPITGQTFGNDIEPITPMLKVDNGGGSSNETMSVRVPVKVPEGYFAMGFIYDDKTKQLEGMPTVAMDPESITVGTRHFSDFFISMILKTDLEGDIDSHFRPGIDDWEFDNPGSYIAPGGYCAGSTLTAMWYYYTQPDGKDLTLNGRYDNNGNKPATPDLCGTIHWASDSFPWFKKMSIGTVLLKIFGKISRGNYGRMVNGKRFRVLAIMSPEPVCLFNTATHEPQQIGVYRTGGAARSYMLPD